MKVVKGGTTWMWNIKEKDLDEFKITCRNRLSPEAAVGFMLGSMHIHLINNVRCNLWFGEIWLVRIS